MNKLRYVARKSGKRYTKRSKVNLHKRIKQTNYSANRFPLLSKRILKRFRSYRPSRQARQSEVGCGGNPLNQRKKTYAWNSGSGVLRSRSSISVWLKHDHPPRLQYSFYIASQRSGVLASLSHWKSRVQIPSKLPYGFIVQLVRTPACHAGGQGFKSPWSRHHPNKGGFCL